MQGKGTQYQQQFQSAQQQQGHYNSSKFSGETEYLNFLMVISMILLNYEWLIEYTISSLVLNDLNLENS